MDRTCKSPNTFNFLCSYITSPIAVCKGLVIDRLQNFTDQASVIPIKASSASYGILCWEVYGKKHSGQRFVKNRIDGNKYAANQIDWLIVKGKMSKEGDRIKRRYSRVIDLDDQTKKWSFGVVWSQAPLDNLPTFLDADVNAAVICYAVWESESRAEHNGTLRRRRLVGKQYSIVDYELTAIMTLGKLKFKSEIVGLAAKNGEVDLKVRWPEETGDVEDEEQCGLIKGLHATD